MAEDRHKIFRAALALPDDKIDLGRAALAIAQEEYPNLQVEFCLARLEQLAATELPEAGTLVSELKVGS